MKHQEQYYDIYKQLNQPQIDTKAEEKILRISELKENPPKAEVKEIPFKSERDFRSSNLSEQALKPSVKQTLNLFEQGPFSSSQINKNSRILNINNQK